LRLLAAGAQFACVACLTKLRLSRALALQEEALMLKAASSSCRALQYPAPMSALQAVMSSTYSLYLLC
jgi:hypothetical protein